MTLAKEEQKPEAKKEKTEPKQEQKPEAKEQKTKQKKEEKKKEEKKPVKIEKQEKPDFKYIVRLANTDLDGLRSVELALADIKGIGMRTASIIADSISVPRNEKLGNLTDEQISQLEAALTKLPEYIPSWMLNRQNDWESGDDLHIFGTDVIVKVKDDINLMKKIRCYKGIRHELGQKVRGQRTRSNGRTGLAVGVMRKEIKAKQAEARAEEKKSEKK